MQYSTVGKVRSPSNTTSESKRAQALRKLLADTYVSFIPM